MSHKDKVQKAHFKKEYKMEKLKSLWAKFKVQISFVAGCLVVATSMGTCSFDPSATSSDAVSTETTTETVEVTDETTTGTESTTDVVETVEATTDITTDSTDVTTTTTVTE